jgi:hypothetical protein
MPPEAGASHNQSILRQNVIRALLKKVPVAGDMADQIIFETAKEQADAASKARLNADLAAIQHSLAGQDTDVGDLLNGLRQINSDNEQIKNALVAIVLYLSGKADASTIGVVERAARGVLPAEQADEPAALPAPPQQSVELDRFSLSIAMQKQFNPMQVDRIIEAIPNAPDNVALNVNKLTKTDQLLSWAEGIDGPGLAAVVDRITRLYPRFTLNP